VHAGDELVELDASASRLESERLSERVKQKESELATLRLRLDDSLAALRAQLEQKKLDGEMLRYKSEQNVRLHREGLISGQDDLLARTAARKNDIEARQLRDALVRAQRSNAAQIAAMEAELRTLRSERDEAARQLGLAAMRADRDGVVTSIVQEVGAPIRRGDAIARIADLSSYRVVATISDLHAARLSAGMPLRVRIDEGTSIAGRITSIDPRIENGTARFQAELTEPSNPKLRSNVRADVFVVTGRRDHTLRLTRGALGVQDREDVFVVRGNRLLRVSVRWGLAGEETIEVLEGLREGDEVVTSNMSDYTGTKELRLKR
jgi:HlyD family secretion protein